MIEFYSDRSPIEHLDRGLLAALQEQGLGKTQEKQNVHFCGLVLTDDGRVCVFLPRNLDDKTELNAQLTMRALAKFGSETSNRDQLDFGNESNTGHLATIANIAQDFKTNGLYLERTKRLTRNRGKIDWRRTIARESSILSEQGPIYTDFETTVGSNNSANILASIQAMVISEIHSLHGWWIPEISSRKFEISNIKTPKAITRHNLIKKLKINLSTLFTNRAIRLSHWLIAYLNKDNGASNGPHIFGVQDFHAVWEVMLRSTITNVEHGWNRKLAQPAYGKVSGGISVVGNRGLRTDIIVRHQTGHAIIDAKYYAASDASNAPSVDDFAKQILYESVLRAELGPKHEIRNMYVFPSSTHANGTLTEMFMLRKNGARIADIPAVECKYLSVSEIMQAYCQGRSQVEFNNALGLC